VTVSGVTYVPPSSSYFVNNLVDGNPLYVGKVTAEGVWLFQKFNITSGVMLYANQSNNPAYTDYDTAWANYSTLNYAEYQTLVNR
jgi:hypothetical protein